MMSRHHLPLCSLCYAFKIPRKRPLSVTALESLLQFCIFQFSEMISCSGLLLRPLPRFTPSSPSLTFTLLSPPLLPSTMAVSPFCVSAAHQRRIGKRVRNVPEFKRKAMEKVEEAKTKTPLNIFALGSLVEAASCGDDLSTGQDNPPRRQVGGG